MRSQGKERPAHYWFSFVSDWLRKWREFSGQTHDEVNKKTKQCRITFDTRWKIALLRCGLFFLIVIVSLFFFNIFPRSPICLKIPKRQEAALMMSNEGAPTTRKLNGKRKRREKLEYKEKKSGSLKGRKKRSAKKVQF